MRGMKVCPHCGYENKKSLREITRLWRVKFGSLPVWEMMQRKWIAGTIETPIEHLEDELRRFFGLETVGELPAFLESPTMLVGGGVTVCLDIEARYAAHLAAERRTSQPLIPASALAAKVASEVLPPADAITTRGKRPAKEDRRSRAAFSNLAGLKIVRPASGG